MSAFAALSGLALGGCGASGRAPTTPHRTTDVTTRLTTAPSDLDSPRSGPQLRGPRVGAAQSIRASGTTLLVRITSILDPLRGAGTATPSGMTAVGVQATVTDRGPGGYDGSATSNFSLRSASGQASPVFVAHGICQTGVQDFMNAIGAGETRSGCIAYAIPIGQKPLSVRFSPNLAISRQSLTWVVPPQ